MRGAGRAPHRPPGHRAPARQRPRRQEPPLPRELALNGIEEKKLRTVFYEAIDGDAEAKRKAYYRARKWAISAKVIEIAEGFVIRQGDGT